MIALRSLIGLLIIACLASTTFGADQQQVNAAIAKGAAYLQSQHVQQQGYAGGAHGVGTAGLAGIAMLEGGIKPDDAAIQNITSFIRQKVPSETATYNIALAILFLDRLRDPRDVPAIQLLGTRLYGGMTRDGGYGYQCVDLGGLNVGNHYTLSFYQAAAQQHGLNGATTEQWAVTFGGVTQYTSLQHNPSHGFQPWTQQTLDFVATSSTQVLNFLAVGTPSGLPPISLLDGVSLTEVSQVGGAPEPSSWMMMLAGFGLFGAASRRRRVRASLQA